MSQDKPVSLNNQVGQAAFEKGLARVLSLDRWKGLPGVQAWRKAKYQQLFEQNTHQNLFCGIFNDLESAAASAPKNRPEGYDNPESAALYFGHMDADSYDYPAMLWLERSFLSGLGKVFDVGGHIGIKYYAFKSRLNFPEHLSWTVCDVPAVAKRGQAVAAKRDGLGKLHFTSDYALVEACDLLFASGVVQYLPMSMEQWLKPLKQKPKRLIFNTTAIHPSKSFFTLNSIGTAYCPYRVTSQADFSGQLAASGYRLVDQWLTPGKGSLSLPLQNEYSIEHYSGFVFDLI